MHALVLVAHATVAARISAIDAFSVSLAEPTDGDGITFEAELIHVLLEGSVGIARPGHAPIPLSSARFRTSLAPGTARRACVTKAP